VAGSGGGEFDEGVAGLGGYLFVGEVVQGRGVVVAAVLQQCAALLGGAAEGGDIAA
jgi:hypothetical protein